MRNLCLVALFYGLFSLTSSSAQTSARVETSVRAETFGEWAVRLSPSRYPEPAQYPTVKFVPKLELQEMVCGGADCDIAGTYLGGDIVYVSDDPGMPEGKREAVIVHEIVHYLQKLQGQTNRCRREYEANYVEWSYRQIHGELVGDFQFDWEFYRCTPLDVLSERSFLR
jgi:hypothetical protein